MGSLYPSLEDMVVDQELRSQQNATTPTHQDPPSYSSLAGATGLSHGLTSPSAPPQPLPSSNAYPQLLEYMGMELSPEEIALNMPDYYKNQQTTLALTGNRELQPSTDSTQPRSTSLYTSLSAGSTQSLTAPLSGNSLGLQRAQVSHGIRQVVLCKDKDGKVGMRVKAINKGIFVCLVIRESPAALGGIRFGDQILQINGTNVAGYSSDKVHDVLKKAGENNIVFAVRDRPFERTLTLHKDSTGHIGFQFKEGKITSITVDSSAARNGLLIDHNLLEVNGQNVVKIKDKEISRYIDNAGQIVTITIIPSYIYNHIVKNMANSLAKKMMDHSVPDL